MNLLSKLSGCLVLILLILAAAPAAIHAQTITFAPPRQISVGAPVGQVAITPLAGDFNGDGKTDYLVNAVDQNNIPHLKVLLGNGRGSFSVINVTNAPAAIDSYLVADVNGDGEDDIITLHGDCDEYINTCPNVGDSAFTVLLSDGTGHFNIGDVIRVPVGYASGVVGDFNKDGKVDIAVLLASANPSFDPPLVMLFTNRGNGSFTASYLNSALVIPESLLMGDFNGDGNLDLALVSSYNQLPQSKLYTLAGHGNSTFDAPHLTYTFDSFVYGAVVASDLNGDGRTDLVVSLTARSAKGAQPRIATLLAKATGGFSWTSSISTPYIYPLQISLSDLNGDGKQDLIGVGVYNDKAGNHEFGRVYPGLGSGRFGSWSPLTLSAGGVQGDGLAAAPLIRGALPSLLVSNGLSKLDLLVNTTR